jgi:uncharacterized protein (DUF3084 family)
MTAIKLSKDKITALVQAREEELAIEAERQKLEKSLKTLIAKMAKKNFYISKRAFAHMEKEEKDRWVVGTYRSSN